MMTIEQELRASAGVLALAGRMDADQAGLFEAACNSLAAQGAKHLVVDLAKLEYVSSMGIRAFLTAAKSREAAGARLVLVNLGGFVKQVFDMTRLTPLFQTADSVEAAIQSLES